jgi:hypothetical protein
MKNALKRKRCLSCGEKEEEIKDCITGTYKSENCCIRDLSIIIIVIIIRISVALIYAMNYSLRNFFFSIPSSELCRRSLFRAPIWTHFAGNFREASRGTRNSLRKYSAVSLYLSFSLYLKEMENN